MVIKNGEVSDFGPTNKMLSAANSELSLLIDDWKGGDAEDGSKEEIAENEKEEKKDQEKSSSPEKEVKAKVSSQEVAAAKRLKDEDVLTGRVNPKAYQHFFHALGYGSSVVMLFTFFVNQAVSTGSTIWLAAWSDHSGVVLKNISRAAFNDSLADALHNNFYLGVFGAFGASQAAASFFRNWFFFWTCAKGSVVIHRSLFRAIIRAKMRFFDTTPTGSVINREDGEIRQNWAPLKSQKT
jgi:hypothetical protein